jgi:hypothetical protein
MNTMTHAIANSAAQEPPQETRMSGGGFNLGSWKLWLVIGAAALIAGTAFNWSWLVAVGLAPLLVTLLPCAVMCAQGLCMHKSAKGSCHGSPQDVPSRGP